MKYSLRRIRDGAGCEGRYSRAIVWNDDDTFKEDLGIHPTVGCSHLVQQGLNDFWLTTVVTEILEYTPIHVIFRTKNSDYEWKIIE